MSNRDYGDGLAVIFAVLVKLSATGVKYGAEMIDEKINVEKNKEKVRKRLAILEYAEDAKNKRGFYTPDEDEENRLVDMIKINDPDFNKEMFEHYAEDVFTKFLKAYCDNNLDSLRKFINIDVLEKFKRQSMKNAEANEKEQIDIEAINYVDFFGFHKESNLEIVSVAVGLVYKDYVKDNTGAVIRGDENLKRRSVYLLSFARKMGGKTINHIKDYKDGVAICPNCGGEITSSFSECEHCGTVLFNSTENWLLTYIEEI